MGWSQERIVEKSEITDDITCSICTDIVQSPLQTPCQHVFCKECITNWIKRGNDTCPVDRALLKNIQLKPLPRIIQKLINRLTIRCENYEYGCSFTTKLENLSLLVDHQNIQCVVAKYDTLRMESAEMKEKIGDQEKQILDLQQKLEEGGEKFYEQLQQQQEQRQLIDNQTKLITERETKIDNQQEEIGFKSVALLDKENEIEEMSIQISEQAQTIDRLGSTITEQNSKVREHEKKIEFYSENSITKENMLSLILQQNIDTNTAIKDLLSTGRKRDTQDTCSRDEIVDDKLYQFVFDNYIARRGQN